MKTKHICFYLSDHGFGHIARNLPIIYRLLEHPEVRLTVVCGERHNTFAKDTLSPEQLARVTFRSEHTDIGWILQEGTLLVDDQKMEVATKEFLENCPRRSQAEAQWLVENQVDVAVCDMPIWSIETCRLAGVPLQYIGNFTWTELYREHLPEKIWNAYAKEYRKLQHVMLYALHDQEMLEFLGDASDIQEVSVQCRPFDRCAARQIREKHKKPLVFVALGMSASFKKEINVEQLPYDFIVNDGVPLSGSNVIRLDWSVKNTQDYVLASDYVISKAGWGTIAEALLARKPMALFARDTVLEDRTSIAILESQKLAVRIEENELEEIPSVIERMKKLSEEGFAKYHDSSEEIAKQILSLTEGERKQ